MKIAAWLIGGVVFLCGLSLYVKAPQDMCVVTAVEKVPTKAVLYIGDGAYQEPWADVYPEESAELRERLAGTEYRCVVYQPRDEDCIQMLILLRRTQPLAQTILLGDDGLRRLAGEYRMDYMNPENMKIVRKTGIYHGRTDFRS